MFPGPSLVQPISQFFILFSLWLSLWCWLWESIPSFVYFMCRLKWMPQDGSWNCSMYSRSLLHNLYSIFSKGCKNKISFTKFLVVPFFRFLNSKKLSKIGTGIRKIHVKMFGCKQKHLAFNPSCPSHTLSLQKTLAWSPTS